MPWDEGDEVRGNEGREGSDRSDKEEQLDVKVEQVFYSVYLIFLFVNCFVLALDLFKYNLLYVSNKNGLWNYSFTDPVRDWHCSKSSESLSL